MGTLTTVASVFDEIETDLPDATLQRMVDTAEVEVRAFASKGERATLPVIVWAGIYEAATGVADGTLTLPSSIRDYPLARLEGDITPAGGGELVPFELDTTALETNGTGTATFTLTDSGTFDVTVSDDGLTLTIDTTSATSAFTICRVLGLQSALPPVVYVSAVHDLVKLAAQYEGPEAERVGTYAVTFADYHKERNKVLERLAFAGTGPLLA